MLGIKDFATLCGCSVYTLRYYDQIDLLETSGGGCSFWLSLLREGTGERFSGNQGISGNRLQRSGNQAGQTAAAAGSGYPDPG